MNSLALVGTLLAMSVLSGCDAVTDPGDRIRSLTLLNDLGVSVDVAWCADASCDSLAGTTQDRLAPGQRLGINVSGEGLADYYRIDQADHPKRCLRVSINDEEARSTVPLSRARRCE